MSISPDKDITQRTSSFSFDIYLVGVGGQGVLSIGEIIAEAAYRRGIPINYYPTKGMAQRGGFVKAQLRLGRASVGPAIPEKGADLIIATEISESLKSIRFIKPGGDFVLFGEIWQPTAVILGKAPYPKLEQVLDLAIQSTNSRDHVHFIEPESLPLYKGIPVPENIFTLAVALGHTPLGEFLPPSEVEPILRNRWKQGVERNLFAYRAGLEYQ
jgi:indolepyruvate ferredoxin oxidoreductase beta subunit